MVVEVGPVPALSAFVTGIPRPQGSKVAFGNGGMRESSKYVRRWRNDIRYQLTKQWRRRRPLAGPIRVQFEFVMPRPKALPRSRTPPAIRRPDWDKLSRAVCDAITDAGVYADDSQIIEAHVYKRIAQPGESPGVHIHIYECEVP